MTQINEAALNLIKKFEGYGQALKDGSGRCTAYQEVINGKRDIPTIGWGCTKGVKMGDVWTKDQAEAALMHELNKHSERVTRLVTIELNENEFGALVSFDYNCGGLRDKTLRTINKGDRQAIVKALGQWNKFGGKVANGLVSRRAAEVALFLKPVEDVAPDYMPQQPDAPAQFPDQKTGAIVATTGGLGVGGALLADPVGLTSSLVAVKGNAGQLLSGLNIAVWSVPIVLGALAVGVLVWLNRRAA
jgi:lysozyme